LLGVGVTEALNVEPMHPILGEFVGLFREYHPPYQQFVDLTIGYQVTLPK
jgi:hypothetical protein